MLQRVGELLSILQYRDFRLFWLGLLVQVAGQSMMFFTFGWLAYDLTGSPLALGGVGLAMSVPRISLTLVGGFIADRLDQRIIITVVQFTCAAIMVGLATLTLTGMVEIWHLYLAAVAISTVQAFDEPSRQSLFPQLLPDRSMMARAVPLNSIAWEMNRVLMPAVAGFIIAYAGADISLFLSAVGFATMASLIRLLHNKHVARPKTGSMLRNITEGARYSWTTPIFRVIMGTVFFNSLFGMSYVLILPVFADEVLKVDSRGLGVLTSSVGIGALLGIVFMPRMMSRFTASSLIFRAILGFGLALLGFALSRWFIVSLLMLAIVGFCSLAYMTVSQVVLQRLVPDELRGRVMGLWAMTWSLNSVGTAILSAGANFFGASAALAASSLLVLAFCLLITGRASAFRGLGIVGEAKTHAGVATAAVTPARQP